MSILVCLCLASALSTFVYGLPACEVKRNVEAFEERAITLSTLEPTTSYSRAITTLQSVSPTEIPTLTGIIQTALPSHGVITVDPIDGPGLILPSKPLCPAETPLAPGPTEPLPPASANIFQPIASGGPAPSIPLRADHVVRREHIVDGDVPIQTNKFYANFFLGSQGFPVWTHPFSLWWAKGTGGSYGIAVGHVERSRFAFDTRKPPQYFIAPIGIQHMALSAAELGSDTVLSVESLKAFSVYANLAPSASSRVLMSFPCVQGMGFVTAIYDRAQPIITSGVFFLSLKYAGRIDRATYKYRIRLNDQSWWMLYATQVGSSGEIPFTLNSTSLITGPPGFTGMIQITKNPSGTEGEDVFDSSAGAYPINATITGSVDGSSGSYTMTWAKGGIRDRPLLMYALPHQRESFDEETREGLKNISLVTTTKGYAQAVVGDQFTMVEDDLPNTIGFAPWDKASDGTAGGSENINLDAEALSAVNEAGISELSQNMDAQTRLNSMYYSGKGLAKFATICYTLNSMAGNSRLAASGLGRLKEAFSVFVNNTQPEPLVYDQVWKGIVSSATYKPPYDTGLDFGNTMYNDHHFHYGYFVYTAAVIGFLDPTWLDEVSNRAWVNMLVKDFANPVTDEHYPFQRSFDWFHGHSWAKGLFESGDGKDQESTSEDTFATYAIKMWGRISRDANMEARANLQLAVQARSMKNYFLLTSDNANQPSSFVPNKVTGILFENKVDHTTYFGSDMEYIQGIHMIPLNPSSAYTRSKQFVTEEWETYFNDSRLDDVQGGWKGILYANLALTDPERSYEYFKSQNATTANLDGGASLTWYLAYSAALRRANTAYAAPDADLYYSEGAAARPGPASAASRPGISALATSTATPTKTWPVGFTWPKAPTQTDSEDGGESQADDIPFTESNADQDEDGFQNPDYVSLQDYQSVQEEEYTEAEQFGGDYEEDPEYVHEDTAGYEAPDMEWGLQDKAKYAPWQYGDYNDDTPSDSRHDGDWENQAGWVEGPRNGDDRPDDRWSDDSEWEYELECEDTSNDVDHVDLGDDAGMLLNEGWGKA
ncbi:endo-1,3-beta glucanase [Coniothyrium glycines]